jgi:hypothetical protein
LRPVCAQAWLEAGFAYAAVDYRGSVTFGRAFREGFWRAGVEPELADVRAALEFLRGQGVARPGSTFVTGASYGGHMTLHCLGRLPGDLAGGFAHVAMADWASAFEEMSPAVRGVGKTWIGGDARTAPEAVARFSAITYVDRVRGSVWLNQGSRDARRPDPAVRRRPRRGRRRRGPERGRRRSRADRPGPGTRRRGHHGGARAAYPGRSALGVAGLSQGVLPGPLLDGVEE